MSNQKKKQPRLEDPRLKDAEQELDRERIALQQRQEDEKLKDKALDPAKQHEEMDSEESSTGENGGLSSENPITPDSQ